MTRCDRLRPATLMMMCGLLQCVIGIVPLEAAEEPAPITIAWQLGSAAFTMEASIPTLHTCDGANTSPALTWSTPPPGTVTLALTVTDPDAPRGTWVHWVVYNLPGSVTELPSNIARDASLAHGALQGVNDFGRIGYDGPCPPPGTSHRYVFSLYALSARMTLPARVSAAQLEQAMRLHVIGHTRLIGRYQR